MRLILISEKYVQLYFHSRQDITGEDAERSKFYLESSNWQLDVALSAFYENSDAPPTGAAGRSGGGGGGEESMDTEEGGEKKAPAGKVTFGGGGGSDSDSEDEGQAFYAGGSTSSGQQVRKTRVEISVEKNQLISMNVKHAVLYTSHTYTVFSRP